MSTRAAILGALTTLLAALLFVAGSRLFGGEYVAPANDPGPPIILARPAQVACETPAEGWRELKGDLLRKARRWSTDKSDHDRAIELIEGGDASCIPVLMGILAKNRPSEPGGPAVCTYGHAAEALRAIVGEEQGWDYEAWRAWYARYKRQTLDSERVRAGTPSRGPPAHADAG